MSEFTFTITGGEPDAAAVKALVKAQAGMGAVIKGAVNPHFKSKYADLQSVMDAVRPALTENGIWLSQPIGVDEIGQYADTLFLHESGTGFRSRVYLSIGGNATAQQVGSAITYARRYGLLGMAGLAPEDDDGNAASKAPAEKSPTQQAREDAVADGMAKNPYAKRTMNKARGEAILAEIAECETVEELMELQESLERHEADHPKIAEAVTLKLDFLTLAGAE